MSSKIQVEMAGDAQSLIKELNQATARIETLEKQFKAAGKESQALKDKLAAAKQEIKDAGTKGDSFAQSMVNGAKKIALAYVGAQGVRAALQLVGAEIDQIEQKQKRSADATRETNASRQSLRFVMPEEMYAKSISDSSEISLATTLPKNVIQQALATAYSSAQGNYDLAKQSVIEASRISPDQPQNIEVMSGAFLDVAKALNIGIKDAVGYVMVSMRDARITDLSKLSSNLPKAITGAKGFGFSDQASAALFTATTANTADFTGEQSRTAAISFAQQIDSFFNMTDKELRKLNLSDRASALRSVRDGSQRVRFLQENKDLGELFLSQMSVEKQAIVPFQQLIRNGGSKMSLDFVNFQKSYTPENLNQIYQYQTSPDVKQGVFAETERAYQNAVNQLQISDQLGAVRSVINENMIQMLKDSGMSNIAERFNVIAQKYQTLTDVPTSEVFDNYVSEITDAASKLVKPSQRVLSFQQNEEGFYSHRYIDYQRPPTQTEAKQAEILLSLLEKLRPLSDEVKLISDRVASPAGQEAVNILEDRLGKILGYMEKASENMSKSSESMSKSAAKNERANAATNRSRNN